MEAAHEPQERDDQPQQTTPYKRKLPSKVTGRTPTKKDKYRDSTDPTVGEGLQDYLQSKRNKSNEGSAQTDVLAAFFKAMEETVRSFSVPIQIEIKGKIANLFNEYELKNYEAQQRIFKTPTTYNVQIGHNPLIHQVNILQLLLLQI